jgi:single-stranded-DNA-specific exonuclease
MSEIKNLKKVANRIVKAIKNKEKIILYGDADLDGVTSVIILKETIKNLGGEVAAIYFPNREIEGYGITETGLNYINNLSPALLVALDLGIGNFKEVKLAKKLGFEVIIVDHHEILDKLPEAEIVVDPKQEGDKHPFKELATVGIIFELSQEIFKNEIPDSLKKSFLELTALGTIADMMPRKNDNDFFIKEGLKSLENSWRPGIQVFFKEFPVGRGVGYSLNLDQKVFKIISILNVRDVKNNLPASFRLLTTSSVGESKEILKELFEKSKLRREKINEIIEEIEERISGVDSPIVFEGDSNFDFTLLSVVASLICKKYKKPTFVFKKLEKESQGTVRAPSGINTVVLMKKCKKYLLTYGGHPAASGFRIKNENLEKFKECLIKQAKRILSSSSPSPRRAGLGL